MRKAICVRVFFLCLSLPLVAACSPRFDFREVHGGGFTAAFPAKPSTLARPVTLDGRKLTMTMMAAEVDDISFAVGSAEVPDATQAAATLRAMKAALVNNIHGQIKGDKTDAAMDIEALGSAPTSGARLLLIGHFAAKDKRVYQVIVIGPEKRMPREAAETFIDSFKME